MPISLTSCPPYSGVVPTYAVRRSVGSQSNKLPGQPSGPLLPPNGGPGGMGGPPRPGQPQNYGNIFVDLYANSAAFIADPANPLGAVSVAIPANAPLAPDAATAGSDLVAALPSGAQTPATVNAAIQAINGTLQDAVLAALITSNAFCKSSSPLAGTNSAYTSLAQLAGSVVA